MQSIKLFIIFCFTSFSLVSQAQSYELLESDVDFDPSTGEIIDYLNTTKKDIIIPDNFGGVSVTRIGRAAFSGNELTNVTIPGSVDYIASFAFYLNALTEVTIPNSVTYIGESAFTDNELSKVTIPNSVTYIGISAFKYNELTEVIIPNSVTFLRKGVFSFNKLSKLTIPNSVTSIDNMAFYGNELTEVIIPNSVTSFGYRVFQYNQLSEVTIPSSVTSIGTNVFMNNQLSDFKLPNHNNGYSYTWTDGSSTYHSGDLVSNLTLAYNRGEKKGAAVNFSIIYNINGGDASNLITYTVEDARIDLLDATKTGYTFDGWYAEAEFTNKVTEIVSGSTGDVELFAKYTEVVAGIFSRSTEIFSFYPNPSSDYIHTELEFSNLTIINSQGAIVSQFNSSDTTYDVSDLESGVYLIQATGVDGTSYTSKLIKN